MTLRKNLLAVLAILLSACLCGCGGGTSSPAPVSAEGPIPSTQPPNTPVPPPPTNGPAPFRSFRVVETFPHDTSAFTQGLLFHQGRLYESTGLVGSSSLREVELETGATLRRVDNSPNVFAEGLALRQGRLYQLTLQSEQTFVWDLLTFQQVDVLPCPRPAWGLEWDGQNFLLSDGTANISVLDSESFAVLRTIPVTDDGTSVGLLNELELIDGLLWANRFLTDEIVAIDPNTGVVAFRLDLSSLIDRDAFNLGNNDVLNGIAYDSATGRIFVTGKRWPLLFQIALTD